MYLRVSIQYPIPGVTHTPLSHVSEVMADPNGFPRFSSTWPTGRRAWAPARFHSVVEHRASFLGHNGFLNKLRSINFAGKLVQCSVNDQPSRQVSRQAPLLSPKIPGRSRKTYRAYSRIPAQINLQHASPLAPAAASLKVGSKSGCSFAGGSFYCDPIDD